MTKYNYHTSHKSFLDNLHDNAWNQTAEWLGKNFYWITPNMVTLMGAVPCYICFLCFMTGILGLMAYPLMALLGVFYLNIDAIDGKLARATGRSSPFGQVLDHGCDAVMIGFYAILLAYCGQLHSLDSLSPGTNVLVFLSVCAATSLACIANLTEFYTGAMIVSVGPISTTELCYLSSFVFFVYYFINSVFIGITQLIIFIFATTGMITYMYGNLLQPEGKREGTEEAVKPIAVVDYSPFLITVLIGFCIALITGFSPYENVITSLCLSSAIIDVIFSNALKLKSIDFDVSIPLLMMVKATGLLIFGSTVGMAFDILLALQWLADKSHKKELLDSMVVTQKTKTPKKVE